MSHRASVFIDKGNVFEDISLAWPFASPVAESTIDLAAIVDAYSTLLFRVANSIVHNAVEAEDVVQDVFVRVVQHQASLPEVRDLRVWLVRIAWNLALDRRRRIRPEQFNEALVATLPGSNAAADEAYSGTQRLRHVMHAIECLPKAERQALSLSALEELDTAEIGRIMGKSDSAVRALLFRARTHLRERLMKKRVTR